MSRFEDMVYIKFGDDSSEIYDNELVFTTEGPAISTGRMDKKISINLNKFTGTIIIDRNKIDYRNCGKDVPMLQHNYEEVAPDYMEEQTIVNLDVIQSIECFIRKTSRD